MKKIYSGLQRRVSQSRSSGERQPESGDSQTRRPRRSSSLALLEGATFGPRARSNTGPRRLSRDITAPAHLVLTTDAPEFDRVILRHFQEEGFNVSVLPFKGDLKDYDNQLQQLEDPLEAGDKYAIVAYGEPATYVLDACVKPMPKLCAVVAYYPSRVPNNDPADNAYSPHIQIHLSSTQGFAPKSMSFIYANSEVGFAERNRAQYDKLSARLAWSRTLSCLRKGFAMDIDIDSVWENHLTLQFSAKDADAAMGTVTSDNPLINFVPTMTGGTGYKDFRRFFSEFVVPSQPPSLNMQLVSRTVGSDQIVDEMYVSFRHTEEVPWMLPGVPPTDKFVEIAVVNIVSIRGGKVCHRQVYWDHASVLAQVGLLDPKLIPPGFRVSGGGNQQIDRLPVVGAEGARKVLDEDSEKSNELISEWQQCVR